jgi:hypothetical protein
MARTLTLNPPFQGLSSIVNVLHRVGPQEVNDSSDVKVVQTLLRMHQSPFAKKVGVPQATGNYDAVTGFYIYDTQYFLKTKAGHQGVIVDGIVSPAQGGSYSAGAPWTIVLLNLQAQKDNPAEYAAFVSKANAGTL